MTRWLCAGLIGERTHVFIRAICVGILVTLAGDWNWGLAATVFCLFLDASVGRREANG